jgi:tyrosyl-tRNA synthetase
MRDHPEKREGQKFLADALCDLVHGKAATEDAKRAAGALFGGSLEGLSDRQILEMLADAPSTTLSREEAHKLDIVALVGSTVASSKGEARRLIQGGGMYLDGERVTDATLQVASTKLFEKGFVVLRSGKKNYHLVKVKD